MTDLLRNNFGGFRWEPFYSRLPEALYMVQTPSPVRDPKLLIFNDALAETLGLKAKELDSEQGAALLAGNRTVEGIKSIAQTYAGHQFGYFTILGDGRAVLLGEHRTPSGALVDIQLKGSGPTSFSRGGDGRLALGPALREFIMSEAMAALGIPTTRSLAVVTTGEVVLREERLPGAVLTRIASSHVRVGTFQYTMAVQDKDALVALVDYCIAKHYPELGEKSEPNTRDRVGQFYEKVIERQASLVAKWLSIGFIHGVMNTDNMAISGETIDYGPCAFLDAYDPTKVFSSIDRQGRYAFGQQPGIAAWNLARLGEALIPLLADSAEDGERIATSILEKFSTLFNTALANEFGSKLGLSEPKSQDLNLIQALLEIAAKEKADFNDLFIELTDLGPQPEKLPLSFKAWAETWATRLKEESTSETEARERMQKANPIVIPRNHQVENALSKAREGNLTPFHELLAAVRAPFVDKPESRRIGAPPTEPDPTYRTFCGT